MSKSIKDTIIDAIALACDTDEYLDTTPLPGQDFHLLERRTSDKQQNERYA